MTLLRDLMDPEDNALAAEMSRGAAITMVLVGSDHRIVLVEGGELLEALGYFWPDEIVGQPVEIFLPPDLREAHKGWFDEWLEHPQERKLREAQPMKVWKKNGGLITVRISIRKFYLKDGARLGAEYAGRPFRGGVADCFVIAI